MKYQEFKMVTTVTSENGEPVSEFTTWRADFISKALTAMGLLKLAKSSDFTAFMKHTLGENEDNDKVLMKLPYSENFEKGETISVEIKRNKKE